MCSRLITLFNVLESPGALDYNFNSLLLTERFESFFIELSLRVRNLTPRNVLEFLYQPNHVILRQRIFIDTFDQF